jgi:hypothetical protein
VSWPSVSSDTPAPAAIFFGLLGHIQVRGAISGLTGVRGSETASSVSLSHPRVMTGPFVALGGGGFLARRAGPSDSTLISVKALLGIFVRFNEGAYRI